MGTKETETKSSWLRMPEDMLPIKLSRKSLRCGICNGLPLSLWLLVLLTFVTVTSATFGPMGHGPRPPPLNKRSPHHSPHHPGGPPPHLFRNGPPPRDRPHPHPHPHSAPRPHPHPDPRPHAAPSKDVPHRLAPHKLKHVQGRGPPPPRHLGHPHPNALPHAHPTPLNHPHHAPLKHSPRGNPNIHPVNKQVHHHRGKMPSLPHDLHPAAQTLYDLRGFNIPLGGQEETQRFLRQQSAAAANNKNNHNHNQNPDPFSRPSGFHPPPNPNNPHNDPRTAPLVFPSFYNQHNGGGEPPQSSNSQTKRAPQQILNIFGHTQHLSQTKYEPANENDNTGEGPDFRPSQVDLGFNKQNQGPRPTPTQHAPVTIQTNFNSNNLNYRDQPQPAKPTNFQSNNNNYQQNYNNGNNNNFNNGPSSFRESTQNYNEISQKPSSTGGNNQVNELGLELQQGRQVGSGGQQILNYRAPQLDQVRPSSPNQLRSTTEEPFIYVYDDEDYEEGDDDDFSDKPQGQINANRLTTPRPPSKSPAPTFYSTTQAPALLRQSTTTQSPFNNNKLFSSTTQSPNQYGNGNEYFPQNNNQPPPRSNNNNNFFNFGGNQESPFFQNIIQGQNQNQAPHLRPGTLIITPRPNVEITPSSERKPPPDQSNAITPTLHQGRQVLNDDRFRRPVQQQQQVNREVSQNNNNFQRQPHFADNLITQRPIQQSQNFQQNSNLQHQNSVARDPFGQVVNLNEEEEDEIYERDPNLQKLNPFSNSGARFQEPASRLRPVNTLVPKNRVPQEDIILPHNFPFHEDAQRGSQKTEGHNRGDVIRHSTRPTTTTEAPTSPRARPTQPTRPRVFPTRQSTTIPTSTESESEQPKRVRNRVQRPSIKSPASSTFPPFPNSKTSTTTTTPSTTTTPPPSTYDETSQEYYEEYPEVNTRNRVVDQAPIVETPLKSSIRPVFATNQITEAPRRLRPVLVQQQNPTQSSRVSFKDPPGHREVQSHREVQGHREIQGQREQTTLESPTSKTTTGKPLYYAGKMLSKEGGLYAGQSIPVHHIYGSPVPSLPINSVIDRLPAVLDGKVARPSYSSGLGQSNSYSSKNKESPSGGRVRGQSNTIKPEVYGSSPTTPSSPHSRLIHPSRLRPAISHAKPTSSAPVESKANVETFRESPRPQPRTASPKYTRPQATSPPTVDEPQQRQPIRRKKVRPGQKFREASLNPEQSTEVVSVRESVSEDNLVREEPKALRSPRVRPQTSTTSYSSSTTEELSSAAPNNGKLRPRIRPRPNKARVEATPNTLLIEEITPRAQARNKNRDSGDDSKPARKLRPRPRPNRLPLQHSTPADDEPESVTVITQSSVRIGKKPTEAPGRFSSRFRDDSQTVFVSSTQSSTSGDNDEFSGSTKALRTFKTTKRPSNIGQQNKPKRKPQQQQERNENEADDDLPASIRLSAKDVVLNRKPARRIPPGSASDRLKALKERRQKLSGGGNRNGDEEQVVDNHEEDQEDDNKPPKLPRRRKVNRKRVQKPRPQKIEEEEDEDPQEQNDQRSDTGVQNKREITHKTAAPSKPNNELKEYEEEYPANDEYGGNGRNPNQGEYEDHDEDTLEQERREQILNRQLQIPSTKAAARNPSEVSSDEARAVLGIQRLVTSSGNLKQQQIHAQEDHDHTHYEDDHPEKQEEDHYYGGGDEDYYGSSSTTTEDPPTVVVRRTESTSDGSSTTPASTSKSGKKPKNNHTSVVTSTSTRATTSLSNRGDVDGENDEGDVEEGRVAESMSSTTAASLKARLRPNKKLQASIAPPRSSSQQTTQSEPSRQSNLSRLLKLRTSSSTYSPVSSSQQTKLLTMATEDPTLPLESIFPSSSSSLA